MYILSEATNNIFNMKKISKMHLQVLLTLQNGGGGGVMLHIEIGHSNNYNCQIILRFFEYDMFCNNLQHKKN